MNVRVLCILISPSQLIGLNLIVLVLFLVKILKKSSGLHTMRVGKVG